MSSLPEPVQDPNAGLLRAQRWDRWWSDHAAVSLLFIASRAALVWAGLQFDFDVRWMFLSDTADLRDRLLQTVWNFHAYPPGMNLMTGILLKLGGAHAAELAHVSFCVWGLVLANSLLYALRASGLSTALRCGLSLAFCLTPACIYFENLYLYETPVAALLCLATALFHRALLAPSSFGRWFVFFATCALIGWIRSTFHLIWFAALALFAVWLVRAEARRLVLAAAAVPGLLLLSLYLKNLALFGVFGAASSGASNIAHVTVMRLPPEERDAWIREGKLSPFSGISVYASPSEYLPYFPSSTSERWPQLNELDRPSVGQPNFNHWFFLEVGKKRSADARYYIEQRPLEYVSTAARSLVQIFEPSTKWHPNDRGEQSPHHQHRLVLGRYERLYNRLVHGVPWPPIGIYALVGPALVWGFFRSRALLRQRDRACAALGGLLLFCIFNVVYVVLLSSAFTIGESARYRYQIESMLWVVGAVGCVSLRSWLHQLVRIARSSSPLTATADESGAK